ncbi:benzil reductase ((S)-benzoin forming) [Amphibacillus marinus]|uniref:Benzil reductase ((S)-benzoin forming) n=1 Tax=Amphibacillus marinus TaxID=872970 RepID=A0A1H8Q1W2_9BACI|nr:(S)-benzoin forming benzil reductase [Amphibacillus marinus]SEO48066.1 benzil reductase ((S)-benzoin forming) [Amphibacillus marinus]
MRHAIVTGTSKGLGAAIAKHMLQQGVHVSGLARNQNNALNEVALHQQTTYQHFSCDLTDVKQIKQCFAKIITNIFNKETDCVYLVNNAATVQPINTVSKHHLDDVQAHMQLNLLAPMHITSLALKAAHKANVKIVIVNISSGAANRITYGWSAYGASKAGLNHFSETAALEERELNSDNKIIIFDPSIMDTGMQGEIRSTDEMAFQQVEQFKQYQLEHKLRSADQVAKVLLKLLGDEDNLVSGQRYHINDYL